MPKIEISVESLDFVRGLMSAIDEQDNRCTASPYFYVIRDEEYRAVPEGCGDESRYMYDGESFTYEQLKEMFSEEMSGMPFEDFLESHYVESYDVKKESMTPENHNVFFTEKACLRHLEQNRHHFRNPYSYVRHAFRNPEIENIFKVLREIAKQ